MPRNPFVNRPGKHTAVRPNGDTFNLKELVRFGQSVNKSRKKGAPPPVLVVKSKRSLWGKTTQSLSDNPKPSLFKTVEDSEDTVERLKRSLERQLAGGLQYRPEVNETRARVWNKIVLAGCLVYDDEMSKDMEVLAEARPIDTSPTLPRMFAIVMANKFGAFGRPDDAVKIDEKMTVKQLGGLILRLPPFRQEELRVVLRKTAIDESSAFAPTARDLMAALNWPLVEMQAPPAHVDEPAPAPKPVQAPEQPPVTFKCSDPLGLAFSSAFDNRLPDFGIHGFAPTNAETTVDELADRIRRLPQDQQLKLKKPLQSTTQWNKPEFANTAAKLLKAMGWPVPVDARLKVEDPPPASVRVDAPAKDPRADQIGWLVANALQDLNVQGLSGLTATTSVRELTEAIQAVQGSERIAVEDRLRRIQHNAKATSSDIAQQVLSGLGAPMPAEPVSAPPVELAAKPATAPREEQLDFYTARGINQALEKEGVGFPEVFMGTKVAKFIEQLNRHPEAKPVVLAHLAVLPNQPTVRKTYIELSARIQAEVL